VFLIDRYEGLRKPEKKFLKLKAKAAVIRARVYFKVWKTSDKVWRLGPGTLV
jgi:hypothetical protein